MPFNKRGLNKIYGSGGSNPPPTQTLWKDALDVNIASQSVAVQNDIPVGQLTGIETFYTTMIDEGFIPTNPASGNGKFNLLLPMFGVNEIDAAMIAAIGGNATNNNFANGDRNNGAIVGDGVSFIDSNVIHNDPEFSVAYNLVSKDTSGLNVLYGTQRTGSGGVSDRYMSFVDGSGRIVGEGYPNFTANASVANSTSGLYIVTNLNNASGDSLITYKDKTEIASRSNVNNFLPSDQTIYFYGLHRGDGNVSLISNSTINLFAIFNEELTQAEIDTITDAFSALLTSFGR